MSDHASVILEHYRKEAELHGRDTSSTMRDEITRGREVAAVIRFIEHLSLGQPEARVLDVGCGNGYLLEVLAQRFPRLALAGLEYTPEMVAIAQERRVPRCTISPGDVRALPYPDASFDFVVTERCIINILDVPGQEKALREVARVVRPGGHYLCIEAFTDGLNNLNAARAELGLEPNAPPHHNIWFDKAWFLDVVGKDFDLVEPKDDPTLPPPNFLSSHYFISRVMYPSMTRREVLYNTHLVKFWSFLPPQGNYSAIQLHVLRKRQA